MSLSGVALRGYARKYGEVAASHDAAASAVGYLYQAQWGLLELVQAAVSRPDQLMSFERIDDIAWESGAHGAERLLQLKHHRHESGTLGDKSPDLWRTLRVWMDSLEVPGAAEAELVLVTTQTCAPDSALSLLRPREERDPQAATEMLVEAALTARSVSTETARRQFTDLPDAVRRSLVERIWVLDSAPLSDDSPSQVHDELILALPAGHEDAFMVSLWGWWYSVVLDMLQGKREGIRPSQVRSRISDLRDEYTRGNLPTLVDSARTEAERRQIADRYGQQAFVHQMYWVNAPENILVRSIVDYYRAVTQAQLWIEDDLIGLHELEEFEHNLVDEWQREMDWRLADLPADASEQQKIAVGRDLLRVALAQTRVRVRERYDEPFFSRGIYHELADEGQVGWHPDFEAKLEELIARVAS